MSSNILFEFNYQTYNKETRLKKLFVNISTEFINSEAHGTLNVMIEFKGRLDLSLWTVFVVRVNTF